jgi:hypothetical protein
MNAHVGDRNHVRRVSQVQFAPPFSCRYQFHFRVAMRRAVSAELPVSRYTQHHSSPADRQQWTLRRGIEASLWAPGPVASQSCVAAGLITPAAPAGYRNDAVYLRKSRYVPPRWEAVRDVMPTLFDLLESEREPGVRALPATGHRTCRRNYRPRLGARSR